MNQISKKQNEHNSLDLLFAQRYSYSTAKKYFSWRTVVALILAIISPFLTSLNNSVSAYIALIVIIYILLDNLLLERMEKIKKEDGAKIQELFDTDVLNLAWNTIIVKKPDAEIVGLILAKQKTKDYSKLKDWYSSEVSEVDISIGRFLCQRSNVWWDSTLRKKYLYSLYALSVLIGIILIVLGISLNLTLANFILGILLPMVPLAELLVKQIKGHYEFDCCSVELKEKIDETLDKFMDKKEIQNAEGLARIYQDEIYRHRKSCPMVFDWLYWLFRDRQEQQMQFSVKDWVLKYLNN